MMRINLCYGPIGIETILQGLVTGVQLTVLLTGDKTVSF